MQFLRYSLEISRRHYIKINFSEACWLFLVFDTMETWLPEWNYMKNSTCAYRENTFFSNWVMFLQIYKIISEGKQMSCFKWWRIN